jgi:outer membrane protein TolC
MDRPGGLRGGKRWDRDGVADSIEPQDWLASLPLDERGVLRLDADRALDLALRHSREYQTAFESVYLAALDVSLARFQFRPQWLGRQGTQFSHFGTGGFANGESNQLTLSQEAGFTRALAAGGQLLSQFANIWVWEFANGGARVMTSSLAFSLIQPLLRGASREVRLESLTQAERDLLYAVRDFARFRKQFWADVTTVNGYLNLLLSLQNIRNQQANLLAQEQNYRLHLELFEGGKKSRVQVDQAYRGFLAARLGVAQAEADLETALDSFKIRLGLPPTLRIDLDDAPLAQFQLVDPELEKLREEGDRFQAERFKELDRLPSLPSLRQSYDRLLELTNQTPPLIARVERDLHRAEQRFRRSVEDSEQRERSQREFERYRQAIADIRRTLSDLPDKIRRQREQLATGAVRQGWEQLLVQLREVLSLQDDLIAIQTVMRIQAIELPSFEDDEARAIEEALANRLDLMNAKARVTDAWRKVWVAANGLRAGLNVQGSVSLGADPASGNPVAFAAQNTRYTVGLNLDLPLNRFTERNAYRASLINYQRARRAYMALEDAIRQQVRLDLRQLRIERLSFEIARQNVISAARQVESARNQILNARDTTGTSSTLDILDALNALLQARNALARSYISYEQLRIRYLLDLERLRLDERGIPIDEFPGASADDSRSAERDSPQPEPTPAAKPESRPE